MRLIDADALGIGLVSSDVFIVPEYADGWNNAVKIIMAAPTVDAAPIVRCKYCVWYENGKEYAPYCGNPCSELQHPNDDTFCSYGEWRENS